MAQQQQSQPVLDLATAYRELYRAKVGANFEAGISSPFLVPLHLFTYFVIPTLYLAIPHKRRPWLYSARWLILAGILAFNWHMVHNVASLNFASGYGVGLLSAWMTIWNFTLLIWTKPQWDAKRVERRRVNPRIDRAGQHCSDQPQKLPSSNGHSVQKSQLAKDGPNGVDVVAPESKPNGSVDADTDTEIPRQNGNDEVHGAGKEGTPDRQPAISDKEKEIDELIAKDVASLNGRCGNQKLDQKTARELYQLAREQEYEYYWQEYPADASFWTRLDWAFDITTSFRLTGWNWASSCLPPYELPPSIGPYQLPLEFGSHRSSQGYERTLSLRKLVISRIFFNIIPGYIIVDLLATVMTTDPYFVVGPEHHHPLPAHLAPLHPILLSMVRTFFAITGILAALHSVWNLGAVLIALYGPPILGFRAHPWHLPSVSGSFTQVMDHGMAGFWGSFWHQTFRAGFSAPTKWFIRHGYLPSSDKNRGGSGKLAFLSSCVGAIIAFAQSGFIHAAGSYTSSPTTTRYWEPPLFFALSAVGTILQSALSRLLQHQIARLPRWLRRLGNLVFVTLWLWATSWALIDDFGRCGLWLWEPVPFSLARAAGLGIDRRVWRYDWDSLPQWHWGAPGRWWETGIAI